MFARLGMCVCSLTQSRPTLCSPMDCSPPGFSVYRIFRARNTEVGWHFLLQAVFPNKGSNLCFCAASLALTGRVFITETPWESLKEISLNVLCFLVIWWLVHTGERTSNLFSIQHLSMPKFSFKYLLSICQEPF